MKEEERYRRFLSKKEEQWESLCSMCGACCGALDDPCENLEKTSLGQYFCRVYARRFGIWRTKSGQEIKCVPIREKLARGESWPGDEHCGYKPSRVAIHFQDTSKDQLKA